MSTMFDMSAHLKKFYEDHVRLGKTQRDNLAAQRDTNLTRLNNGLDKLSAQNNRKYAHYSPPPYHQGSYAMHTLNQHKDNDYDIDVGVLFKADELPTTALEARKRVAAALNLAAEGFAKEPEARTNAVTVWYAEGHHVDFAVYRQRETSTGIPIIEHAGADWSPRNPLEVNEWFENQVSQLSPSEAGGASVEKSQLRRIVRLVKAFTRSRDSWSLPGGMITTALVVECYQPDSARDDVALYNTLAALDVRLRGNTSVANPVEPGAWLTGKTEYENQVKRFGAKLKENVAKLQVLLDSKCTEAKARSAWDWIFNHDFWSADLKKALADSAAVSSVPRVALDVGVATSKNGKVHFQYRDKPLPKGLWLKFSIPQAPVSGPFEVRWLVENEGDEAEADNGLTHETTGSQQLIQWESTAYKGTHKMTCEVIRHGSVVARGVRIIKVGTR